MIRFSQCPPILVALTALFRALGVGLTLQQPYFQASINWNNSLTVVSYDLGLLLRFPA